MGPVVGRARGKLLLFGEHAAVYGHPAAGLALADETVVTLDGPGHSAWGLDSIPAEDREAVRDALARVEEKLPRLAATGRCAVSIRGGVVRRAGFGSSAALCGALSRAALLRAGEDGTDVTRAWELAHHAERRFHGTPSGVDTGLALLGGTVILQPRPPALPAFEVIPAAGVSLVVAAVRRDEACADLVRGLAVRMRAGDRTARDAISALGELSGFACSVLRGGGPGAPRYMGMLADAAMRRLSAVGLGTPELDLLLEAARRAGALGAKLSGAGGGGAFYAVAPDAEAAAVIAGRITDAAADAGVPLLLPPRTVTA